MADDALHRPLPRSPLLALSLSALLGGCAVAGSAGVSAAVPAPPPRAPGVGIGVSVDVELSFFGVPLGGADRVVFVLDRSGSMGLVSVGASGHAMGMSKTSSALASLGGTLLNDAAKKPLPSKLESAKDELIHTLRAMPDGTRFGVIFFDEEIQALSPRMWILDPDSRHRAVAFIRAIRPGGTTAAVPAMRLAYQMGARRVVLLSDGLANTGGGGHDLLADARHAIEGGLRIDTVGLGLDQDDRLLQRLAAESGGIAVMR